MSALDDKKMQILEAMLVRSKRLADDFFIEAVGNDDGQCRDALVRMLTCDRDDYPEAKDAAWDALMAYGDQKGRIEEAAEALLWHEQQAEAA